MDTVTELAIHRKYNALKTIFDEKSRRIWAATEAGQLGRGGVTIVARATGLSRTTIYQGMIELENYKAESKKQQPARVRSPGGGRKPLVIKDSTIVQQLEALVDPVTRGDPESPLRWSCKSTRQLAKALSAQGHPIGRQKVSELLSDLGYSLQSNKKVREGSSHEDRDAQFSYINSQVKDFQSRGQPVISVDTKKKELVGDFKNSGREWQPEGKPEEVRTYDLLTGNWVRSILMEFMTKLTTLAG